MEERYLLALRERHSTADKQAKFQPKRGDVVFVQSENKNRGAMALSNCRRNVPEKGRSRRAVRVQMELWRELCNKF